MSTSTSTSSRRQSAAVQPRRGHRGADAPASRARGRSEAHPRSPLGGYRDDRGRRRELIAVAGVRGSCLVIDRDVATRSDRRLVAHLAGDEPRENAALVCRHYLADHRGRWCRQLRTEDLLAAAPGDACSPVPPAAVVCAGRRHGHGRRGPEADAANAGAEIEGHTVVETDDQRYCLRGVSGERRAHQLRWCRQRTAGVAETEEWEQISLREIVAALERYEPMRTITARALAADRDSEQPQVRRLRSEYERLCSSPIVLNRALREAVLRAVERDGQSLSELALRCGVVKRDRHGRLTGETSWLARRVGLMAEGGCSTPTPWVHSDVLALIARRALRVSPREVEVP